MPVSSEKKIKRTGYSDHPILIRDGIPALGGFLYVLRLPFQHLLKCAAADAAGHTLTMGNVHYSTVFRRNDMKAEGHPQGPTTPSYKY